MKLQVDAWKAQQKTNLQQQQQQAANMSQGMGMGMGMPYGRPGMQQMGMGMGMGMGMQHPHARLGQSNGMMEQQQVNLDAMSMKELLAHSGIFGHPNSAEYLHWVNVNQEFEQV